MTEIPLPEQSFSSGKLEPKEILVMTCALLAWGTVFTAGFVVNSGPFRDALASGGITSLLLKLKYWFIVITTFTLTNVAILCCLASLVGASGRRLRLGLSRHDHDQLDHGGNPYASAVVAGFFVYLVAISGILVLVESPFASLSADRYVRLAGMISLLSFMVGYSPHMLSAFLNRVSGLIEKVAERTPNR